MLGAGPFTHRLVAHHRRELFLKEDKPRWPMRQPADVRKRFAQQALGLKHQAAVGRPADRSHKSENETFGGRWREKTIVAEADEVTDKKACGGP